MQILFVIRSLDTGGAEKQCRALAEALAARGHSVTLCTLAVLPPQPEERSNSRVRFCALDHQGPKHLIRSGLRLRRLVRQERFDVIYTFLPVSNVLSAAFLSSDFRRRLVWGIRSSGMDDVRLSAFARMAMRLEMTLSGLPAVYIANSEKGARDYLANGFLESKMRVVENSVDTRTYHFDADRRARLRKMNSVREVSQIVAIVARLDPIKGHRTFLDAAAVVATSRSDVEFWVIGGGNQLLLSELQSRAEFLGIANRVKWFGEVRASYEVADLLLMSDLGVNASLSEGFPNAVAEYLACGLRVVGTAVGDTARMVGNSGECVAASDSCGMAQAILRQLSAPSSRAEICAAFLEKFDPEGLLARHEELLAAVSKEAG